jgi:hypothetical protein
MASPRPAPVATAADVPQEFAYVANGDAGDVTAGRSSVTGKIKVD